MSTTIQDIERRQLREVPRFKAGDTVRVHFRVIEGTRQRIQVFEGIVINLAAQVVELRGKVGKKARVRELRQS